ncbi:MAG: murein transglycosylase A [Methyloceanibacter sp.]|uniref:murein transglycosylase A n=1 Tax=Methyloceanibacter sp. TaxID=1965321 RepID=UPI003D9B8D2D
MTRGTRIAAALLCVPALAVAAWWMGRGAVDNEAIKFVPVGFAALPGWGDDDHAAAFAVLLRSCRKISDSTLACTAAQAHGEGIDRAAARVFFETHFQPQRIEGGSQPGFVTGYYEPEIEGSRLPDARFKVPVYRRPDDLVTSASEIERARFNDQITGARRDGDALVPYYTRAEIADGALKGRGLELLHLEDPVELFFLQVQGSGRVRLTDGTSLRLGYGGKNGHPYTSIGKLLVARGEGSPKSLGMDGLKAWLRADPARGRALMNENKSYVFFRELDGEEGKDGPVGAQGVALTPGRSLAVDASYHSLGLPIFVAAPELDDADAAPFRRLMIAQDVGSAIRGPERGDIFWGTGEAAGAIAGSTRHDAQFFILKPKN